MTIYQVDAFTDTMFGGNPAAVVPLQEEIPDVLMQKIAAENNLAETAFYMAQGEDFLLRWFTPTTEVKLCGHATLASAHVLFEELGYDEDIIRFRTLHSGILSVKKTATGYEMDFPADSSEKVKNVPTGLIEGLGVDFEEVRKGDTDYMVVLKSQDILESLRPDFKLLSQYEARGTIVTAPGKETDFVSRCFFPQSGVDEDPTTGSAHTTMTPYWAHRLGKNVLSARQLSERVGNLKCELREDRVLLRGSAVTYLKGEIKFDKI